MDRKKNVKKGLVSGVINNLLTLILPFVSRTIIIYYLGSAYLGLSGVFGSIINILNMSELGFGSALSFVLYKPIAENDEEKVCAILAFAKKCFRAIGLVVLAIGAMVVPFLHKVVNSDIPSDINIYILYSIFLLNSVVSYFLFSYKRLLFSAAQRYDLETTIASIVLILQYIAQIVILVLMKDYYLYIGMTVVASILSNILCEVVTRKYFPKYVCRGRLPKSDYSKIIKIVKGVFATKIGATINLSIDNVVISALFGLILLGKYSNYYYIILIFISLFAVVHNSLRPTLGNCIITDTKSQMYEKLETISFVYTWGASIISVGFLCLAQDFIYIWAGEDFLLPFSYVIVLFALFFLGRMFCVPTLFVEAAGLWYESKYINLITAGLNVLLSLVLAHNVGVVGVPIASVIVTLLANLGYLHTLFSLYFENVNSKLYIISLLKTMLLQLITAAIVYLACFRIVVDSIFSFVLKGFVVVSLSVACFFIFSIIDRKRFQKSWPFVRSLFKI